MIYSAGDFVDDYAVDPEERSAELGTPCRWFDEERCLEIALA